MNKKHLYSSDEKLKWWGYGEWVEEPDQAIFEHNSIECMVVRVAIQEPYAKDFHMFGGHLCGYVRIPHNHPYYGKGDRDIDLEGGNGGLTYSEIDNENHIYLPKKGHWIGFDCAHIGDIIPSMKKSRDQNPEMKKFDEMFPIPEGYEDSPLFKNTYKNIAFCIEECKSLADQLVNMVKDGKNAL